MEELLNLATELMKDDNYKKNTYEDNKPDGDYLVNIDKIELKTSAEKGTQWFSFTTTIIDGDFIEQKIFINLYLTEKTLKRTITSIMNLISSCGYELNQEMFTDFETLEECLQTLINSTITVNKKTNGEFVNYKMTGGAE